MRRLLLLSAVLLTACATPQNNYDPLENVNRSVYKFNTALDDAVVRPVAVAYSDYIPSPLRTAVGNFMGNIDDLFAIPASILQAKGTSASKSTARVLLNSTFGLVGLLDIASEVPIEKQDEDFGQMLGAWGVPSGPYLMVPFYGPLTLRDSSDKLARLAWGPIDYIDPLAGKAAYYSVFITDTRASLLPFDATIAEQIDPYAFVRDTYLQRRWFKIHDGNPPHPLPLGEPESEPVDDAGNDVPAKAVEPVSQTASEVVSSAEQAAPSPDNAGQSQ
ncbi:VacJ family lipoprotein [Chitinibacter sp. GC72]|uniref:MlaA family lipoprotein n=1 Tax=Chitinibacter sp. GC72 TaxID=1526917 RepID=UPI0012F84431|nr:VacJ family lipoprotein [Chitinibacter sp. GC72]